MPYLVDDAAYQRWNEKGKHKFAFYTPQTEDQDMSPQRLMTLMKTEMNKLVNTSVSYEVQAQSIGRIFGLAHELINEGDTIRIIDTGFTPKLYLEARAIAGDESFKDPTQDKYVFGDYREIVDQNDELRRLYQKILSSLYDKVPQDLFDQLKDKVNEQNQDIIDAKDKADQAQKESQTAKDLAEATVDYVEKNLVDIIEGVNPPTANLKPNKTLWRDISNGKPGILKIWTGTTWESVVPDVEKVKKETLEQVSKDIKSTKDELNQKVQTVENKTKEIAGQVADVAKEVGNKVDQTWINNQLKDKADKSGVYTKDEIKDGFIGKQIYETDKQGNVKKFQDINTSIGQTNEALTQKAEKSELKKTSEGLSQLEQKTNEIKTTADGTKQTLTQLKTQVDNTKVGGRNLLVKGDLEKTNSREFVKYADLAPIIDLHGLIEYTISFDIKVAVAGEVQVYMQNGSGAKYKFAKNVNATTQYERRFIIVTPTLDNKTLTESWLSFYGTYDSGRFITVKNVKMEKGNVPTDYSPAPEEQVTTTDFTKKTVEIETTIKGINTTVSNVQNEQGKLTERVTKSEQTADGFKQTIESLTKKDTEISNKLNTVESTVEGTKKTISDVQQTTNDLKKTTTEIKEQAGKISEKLESVEKKANTLNDEFTKKTTEIEKSVDGVKTTVTNVQNNQTGFEKRMNTVEQTVDKNSQTITSLSTTQGEQGKLIQKNTSSIEQLNNEIKLSVSETQMQDYIGEIGTTNIFLNTPFEIKEIDKDGNVTKRTPSLDKWSFTSNTKPGIITEASVSRHHAGYNSLHIQSTGQTSNVYVNAFQDAPMLSNSGAYVLSFWMYTEDVNAIDEGATVGMYVYGGGSQVSRKELALKPLLKSGAWVFIVLNVDAPTVPTTHARMYLTLVKNGSIYLSQPQYQQGTKPSTYMPNPKDITNYKEMIDLVGSKVATSDYNKQVTKYDTQFEQNTREINLRATKESVYTKQEGDGRYGDKAMVVRHESEIKLNADQILQRVKSGEIASTINQTAQSVLIQAQKINLVGAVTAESINSGILRGTQIYTNADVSGAYIKLEKQHLTLMNGTQPRGYFGFITRNDSNTQTALVLGNDYAVNKQLEGSLVIDQVSPGTNWSNAVASIGIASGGKTGNDINKNSYINFKRYMGDMEIRAEGGIDMKAQNGIMKLQTNSSNGIYLDSASIININSNKGVYTFQNGRDLMGRWALQIKDSDSGVVNSGDVDLNIGNQLILRVARQYPYTQEGLQVKNNKGNDYVGISCGVVTYSSLSQRSTRQLKTSIKDIGAIDPLQKLMELQPRQYYMKEDVNKLYEKRQAILDSESGEKMPTYEDIPHQYGFIAEEVPEEFSTPQRKAVNMYPLITMGIAGTQEVYKKHLDLEETVKAQATQLATQEDRIARLEELLLQQLINKKPEQP